MSPLHTISANLQYKKIIVLSNQLGEFHGDIMVSPVLSGFKNCTLKLPCLHYLIFLAT